jgi:hypothetical protein
MNTSLPPIKRGATLSLAGTVELPAGAWSGSAQVRTDKGLLIDTLTVKMSAPVAPATAWSVLIVGDSTKTAIWPFGDLQCDVRFQDASNPPVVLPTETFIVTVERAITHA